MTAVQEAVAPPLPQGASGDALSSSIVLHGVSWDIYQALRLEEDNNHVRMTYDQGALELMSPSRRHAKLSWLLGWMIGEWTLQAGVRIEVGGDTTFSKKDVQRGLEPDHCFWIANEALVRGKDEIDLSVDPPPDLALEVEISRRRIPKLPIDQALKVPEIWRWRRQSLQVLTLDASGQYVEQTESAALRGFPLRLAEQLLRERNVEGDSALMARFRAAIAVSPRP